MSTFKYCVISVLLAVGAHAQAPVIAVSQSAATVSKYDVYELTISHNGAYQNPWEDLTITATFKAPSGSAYTIGGFYYDTNTWKVRFAPREAGTWTWNLTFANTAGSTPATGSFTCSSSTASGFVRLHPTSRYSLITEADQKPFYALGINSVISDWTGPNGVPDGSITDSWDLSDGPGSVRLVSLDTFLGTLGSAGLNMFRFNGESLIDIADFNTKSTGKSVYSIVLGKQRDELAVALHKAKFKIMWGFLAIPVNFVPAWDLSDSNKRVALLRYHQYVINRFSAYIDIWELANEQYNMTQNYVDTVTGYIKVNDPYNHPVTSSYSPNPPQAALAINDAHLYFDTPSLDLDDQFVHGTYGLLNTTAATPNKPQLWGEIGNRCPVNANDSLNERFRILAWTAFFNQAYILPWYSSNGSSTSCTSGLTNLYIGPTQRTHASVFRKYVSDFDALAKPIALTLSAGQRGYATGSSTDIGGYVIQTQSHTNPMAGATLTLNVPASGMAGQWINPQDGSVLSTFTPIAGTQTLRLPTYTADIVFRIRSGATNPSLSPCDLDGNGLTDSSDVQIGVGQVLNPATCGTGDLDRNTRCDVVDLQRLINAVITGICKVGP